MFNKFKIKYLSELIVIASLLFVTIYLFKINYLVPIHIENIVIIVLSYLLIFLGFFFDVISAKIFLKFNCIEFSLSEAIVLSGRYSLAKYIPGKIGVIFGKASYISNKRNITNFRALEIIAVYQILFLISGIIFSVATSYNFLNKQSKNLIILLLTAIGILFLFSLKKSQIIFRKLIYKLIKRDLKEIYSQKSILLVLIGTMFCWFLWGAGFWLFSKSTGIKISLTASMLFPTAAVIGVAALIFPGGLGVREGIISAGLIYFGYSKMDSLSLSVYSRLWFLFAEILYFLLTFIFIELKKESL